MRCLACDKEISSAASVCPHCQRSTEASREAHGGILASILIGGLVGYLVTDGFGAFIGGLIGGFFIGIPYSLSVTRKFEKNVPPAEVSVVPTTGTTNLEESLQTLERLRAQQLISDDEYQAKRQSLLKTI